MAESSPPAADTEIPLPAVDIESSPPVTDILKEGFLYKQGTHSYNLAGYSYNYVHAAIFKYSNR